MSRNAFVRPPDGPLPSAAELQSWNLGIELAREAYRREGRAVVWEVFQPQCTCAWREEGIRGAHHYVGCPKAEREERRRLAAIRNTEKYL